MHISGYVVIGFLIVCMLLAATKALSVANAMMIAVADMAQVAGNNALTASADSGSDIAAAKPNGPHATAIAKTR